MDFMQRVKHYGDGLDALENRLQKKYAEAKKTYENTGDEMEMWNAWEEMKRLEKKMSKNY